jgi:predicted nucleic acid-binding protein
VVFRRILVALSSLAFKKRAHAWWAVHAKSGWASCPIVENGVVRIMSNAGYSQGARFTPGDLISRLRTFAAQTDHAFWPDDVSLRDGKLFAAERIHRSRQLTDLYLLALACKHAGRLATFDQAIPISAVCGANAENLCVV